MVQVVRKGSKLRKSKVANAFEESEHEHHSVSVRKIDNGFVVHKSSSGPKGYDSSETYHEKKPIVDIQSIPFLGAKSPKSPNSSSGLRQASGNKKVKST